MAEALDYAQGGPVARGVAVPRRVRRTFIFASVIGGLLAMAPVLFRLVSSVLTPPPGAAAVWTDVMLQLWMLPLVSSLGSLVVLTWTMLLMWVKLTEQWIKRGHDLRPSAAGWAAVGGFICYPGVTLGVNLTMPLGNVAVVATIAIVILAWAGTTRAAVGPSNQGV